MSNVNTSGGVPVIRGSNVNSGGSWMCCANANSESDQALPPRVLFDDESARECCDGIITTLLKPSYAHLKKPGVQSEEQHGRHELSWQLDTVSGEGFLPLFPLIADLFSNGKGHSLSAAISTSPGETWLQVVVHKKRLSYRPIIIHSLLLIGICILLWYAVNDLTAHLASSGKQS